jgi:transposase-like protein
MWWTEWEEKFREQTKEYPNHVQALRKYVRLLADANKDLTEHPRKRTEAQAFLRELQRKAEQVQEDLEQLKKVVKKAEQPWKIPGFR